MATITDLRARRDALAAQRSSGVARVSYDGKTVDYRSVARSTGPSKRWIGRSRRPRGAASCGRCA